MKKASNEIKALGGVLKNLNIPNEVKVVKSHQIDLKNSMRTVLLLFFVLSIAFLSISVYLIDEKVSELNAREVKLDKKDKELEEEWKDFQEIKLNRDMIEWLLNYRNHFFQLHPKDSKSYLKKNPAPTENP